MVIRDKPKCLLERDNNCFNYFFIYLFLFQVFYVEWMRNTSYDEEKSCGVHLVNAIFYFYFIYFYFYSFSFLWFFFFPLFFSFLFFSFFLLSNVKGSFGSKTETVVPLNHQFFIVFFSLSLSFLILLFFFF